MPPRKASRFVVEPRLLDHFGIAMYNTVEKAIGELAANAYDADATRVRITYTDDLIAVRDNGVGMTREEVDGGYLHLGRNRRESNGERTDRGRAIIGNKGIGKLAGFGIAERMVVTTARSSEQTSFTLKRQELDSVESLEDFEFYPTVSKVGPRTRGTEVRLEQLVDGLELVPAELLREHLARQLPSLPDFAIFVNGEECSAADIDGARFEIDDEITGFGRVRGYYKVVTSRAGLQPGLAIRIRGRIVQEPSLFGLNQQTTGFFALTRIIGELEPDFIDPAEGRSDRDDFIINTSRTGLNEEFDSVQALNQYASKKLRSITAGLNKQRTQTRKKAAFKRNPEQEKRLKALGPEIYARLDTTLETVIGRLAKNESNATIDEIVDLIISYYESDAVRTLMASIKGATNKDVGRLAALLGEYGAARIADIAELLHSQLEIIDLLAQQVKKKALESEIHQVIAKNPWLLRDRLSYWFDNKAFSTQLADNLASEFAFAAAQRPDLVCYDDSRADEAATNLVVVEFKRPGVKIAGDELIQVMQYKAVFRKSLAQFPADKIEVIVLGDRFDESFDIAFVNSAPGYKILSYTEMLEDAKRRYREFYDMLRPE